MKVCVDASLTLSWLLPWEGSEKADAIFEEWARTRAEVIGPPLLFAEVTSVLREAVYRAKISPDEGEEAFRTFLGLGIRKVDHPELHIKAWELARELNQPKAYDAHYLALAELEGCELWTQDGRFYHSAGAKFVNVKWAMEYSP
jgi:predicted nucleic acid-binding protein